MPATPPTNRLGSYDLLERIGDGAEGQVFKARRLPPATARVAAGEMVALKKLRESGNEKQSELFARSARILQALDHPHIVRYKESFVWKEDDFGGEIYCLVTELLEGETLKELIDRNSTGLSWEKARGIFLHTLQALVFADKQKVTHRDLKPSNIYITSQGAVKLIDFGIARHQERPGVTASTGGPQGTWDYMACDFYHQDEKFRGDQQSDIFSFGVCFYQALTGQLPYPPLSYNAQIAHIQRCMAPGKVPEVSYRHPAFSVLRGARACIEKCLAFERARRYRTFSEVLEALEQIQSRILNDGDKDRYEYLEFIGKGGFGRVFRARRLSDGLEVAIKEVLADSGASRFIREAKLLKNMPHPHLVKYLDFFETSDMGVGNDRRLYLILEYLDGMPQAGLRERIKATESGMEPVETLMLFRAYLDCLHHLHQNGIIHRDIKPGNLYAPPSALGRAKIFDLGIAHDSEGTKTRGRVPGTLDYMPPEFATQRDERGSAQSDLYSLGVTLYQCLTRKLPFPRLPDNDPVAWTEWFERSERPLGIPFDHPVFSARPALKDLLLRALAFRPQDRYSDAAAMRDEIGQVLGEWRRASEEKDPRQSLALAKAAFEKEDFGLAAVEARCALEVSRDCAEARQLLQQAEEQIVRRGEYDTAMGAAIEALERNRWEEAIQQTDRALELLPRDQRAQLLRSQAFEARKP